MRSHYELYKLLKIKYVKYASMEPDWGLSIGICHIIDWMYMNRIIESEEYSKLRIHFISNRPTSELHPEFYKQRNFIKNEAYWWSTRDKRNSDKSRLDFLDKMILITKPTHIKIWEKIKNLWR